MNRKFLSLIAILMLFAFVANAQKLDLSKVEGKPIYSDAIECPADATISNATGDETDARTSNADVGYAIANQITGWTEGDITSIRVFGGKLFYNGGWASCTTAPFEFEIKFYEDDGGAPGAELEVFTETLTGVSTGVSLFGNPALGDIYAWDWTPATAVSGLPETFWFSFANTNTDCWMMAINSVSGPYIGMQYNAGWQPLDNGHQFCITAGSGGTTSDVTFTVTDGTDPIVGATVTCDGTDIVTIADGTAVFELADGDHDYSVVADCFDDATGTVTVAGETAEAVVMDGEEFDVTFTVTDGTDPIVGATVTVDGSDETTGDDGIAVFALASADYTYSVAASGYGTITDEAFTVDCDVLTIPVTMIVGNVNGINSSLNIYPNPSNGVFNIAIDGTYNLQIVDVTGKVVVSTVVADNAEINISNEAKGIYFLKFSNENSTFVQQIMVK